MDSNEKEKKYIMSLLYIQTKELRRLYNKPMQSSPLNYHLVDKASLDKYKEQNYYKYEVKKYKSFEMWEDYDDFKEKIKNTYNIDERQLSNYLDTEQIIENFFKIKKEKLAKYDSCYIKEGELVNEQFIKDCGFNSFQKREVLIGDQTIILLDDECDCAMYFYSLVGNPENDDNFYIKVNYAMILESQDEMYKEIYEISSFGGMNNYIKKRGFDISSNKEQDIINSNGKKVGHFINLNIESSSQLNGQNNQLNNNNQFLVNPFSIFNTEVNNNNPIFNININDKSDFFNNNLNSPNPNINNFGNQIINNNINNPNNNLNNISMGETGQNAGNNNIINSNNEQGIEQGNDPNQNNFINNPNNNLNIIPMDENDQNTGNNNIINLVNEQDSEQGNQTNQNNNINIPNLDNKHNNILNNNQNKNNNIINPDNNMNLFENNNNDNNLSNKNDTSNNNLNKINYYGNNNDNDNDNDNYYDYENDEEEVKFDPNKFSTINYGNIINNKNNKNVNKNKNNPNNLTNNLNNLNNNN